MNDVSGFDLVQSDSKFIFLSTKLILYYLQRAYARKTVWIGTESLKMDINAFAFPKHSPLLKPISYQLVFQKKLFGKKFTMKLIGHFFSKKKNTEFYYHTKEVYIKNGLKIFIVSLHY